MPENLCKNRLAVLDAAYVGVLSDERGSPSAEFNPCACSHQDVTVAATAHARSVNIFTVGTRSGGVSEHATCTD